MTSRNVRNESRPDNQRATALFERRRRSATKALLPGLAALLLLVFFLPSTASAKSKWKFVGKHDNVKTWKKKMNGSDVFSFKGEYVANVHIGKILSVFNDPKQRKHWVDRYDSQKILARTPDSQTYRIRFDLPWPVQDRDYVLKSDGFRDEPNGVFTCKIKSVKHKKAKRNGCCVRARAYGTFYRFEAIKTPDGKEKTKVFVEVSTDPKGSLPDWLINMIQEKWPSKTLRGLVRRAKKSKKIDPKYADWHKTKSVAAVPAPKPVAPVPTPVEVAPEAAPAPAAAPQGAGAPATEAAKVDAVPATPK